MAFPSESPLNRFPVLRYDCPVHDGIDGARASSSVPSDPPAGTADMEVNGLGAIRNIVFPKPLGPAAPTSKPASLPSEASALSPRDTVEISEAGRSSPSGAGVNSLRAERLAQIKAAIEDGSYDTPERFDAALDRMFSRLGLWDE